MIFSLLACIVVHVATSRGHTGQSTGDRTKIAAGRHGRSYAMVNWESIPHFLQVIIIIIIIIDKTDAGLKVSL